MRLAGPDIKTGLSRSIRIVPVAPFVLGVPLAVQAQMVAKAVATSQFESNSNVFNLESGLPQQGPSGAPRSDSFFGYGAAFDTQYHWHRQELYLSADTVEYEYQRFAQLNHNDYKIDAGWRWRMGRVLDGKADVQRRRLMVPFYDLGQTALSLQTEQRETLEAGLKVGSNWRLEGKASTRTLDEPLQESPQLQLEESSGSAALKFTGVAGLSAGIAAQYATGDYRGGNQFANPSYRETTAGLVASYEPTGRSTFDGQLGYSKRASASDQNNQSGLTGHLDFRNHLTPKTSVGMALSRGLVNYVANAGSEIDTGATARATWQATLKLAVDVDYTWTLRSYPRQGTNTVGSDRLDHQQQFTMRVSYQPLPWLSIKPYANILRRTSNFIGSAFDSTIFGVSVTAQTPESKSAGARP